MHSCPVFFLPGWQNSGPGHWQTEWEQHLGHVRVEQHDWMHPLRGDWSARLDEVVADTPESVLLVAHGLGCILTAWWAAHSRHAHKVGGALLAAPCDVERLDLAIRIPGWAPIARQRLPFPAVLVASHNDPSCSFERARQLAADWSARLVDGGDCGHINTESWLGDWPQGQALLRQLADEAGSLG